jgi:hypothetical protein
MNTTTNTTGYGYVTAYAGGGTVAHIVEVTGDYYGGYAAAAVCGVSPRIRWSNTRWTGESDRYPTPAAALEAKHNVCKRCAAAVARMTPAESTPAPAESLEDDTVTTENTPAAPVVTVQFPALSGDVVTTAHTRICELQGHATHTVDGVDTGRCPRCGDLKAPAAPVKGDPSTWTEDAAHTWTDCSAADTAAGEHHYTVKATGECWSCDYYARPAAESPAPTPANDVLEFQAKWEYVESHGLHTVTPRPGYVVTLEDVDGNTWSGDSLQSAIDSHAAAAVAAAESRAAELVQVSAYPGERVELDPATAPRAAYRTARARVMAYYRGTGERAGCIDSVIVQVTGGDSHPARMFAASDALTALQSIHPGNNITAGQYQTIPVMDRGTIFIYGTWND